MVFLREEDSEEEKIGRGIRAGTQTGGEQEEMQGRVLSFVIVVTKPVQKGVSGFCKKTPRLRQSPLALLPFAEYGQLPYLDKLALAPARFRPRISGAFPYLFHLLSFSAMGLFCMCND